MSEDRLSEIGAHRLLNSVSAIHGLIAVARSLHQADPGNAEIDELLRSAGARAREVATQLHQLVQGRNEVIDLDAETSPTGEHRPRG